MKTSQTFSILFWVNASRAIDGQAKLYARVTVNGKRANFSLKRHIKLSLWDPKRSKLKGNSAYARSVNKYLDQTHMEIFQAYEELRKETDVITADAIRRKYLKEDQQYKSLEELFAYHNKISERQLQKATLRHYKTTQRYLREFIYENKGLKNVALDQVDYKFLIGFEHFLRNYIPTDHQKPIGNNTVMRHMTRLKKMTNLAIRIEWLMKDPFLNYKTKYQKSERTYLNAGELKIIEEKSLSIGRLEYVRDLFVFSCYSGLSYIDIMHLKQEHLQMGFDGNIWIVSKRQKSGTTSKVPLLEKAKAIVLKYGEDPRARHEGRLFHKISNQKLNAYLKELAILCEINKTLTFHMARHTFATTVTLSNGVPIETVSKMLGHTKLATTQIYARVLDKKISEDMNSLALKLNSNKD
ncbi:Site-specific recombinase XerD [Zhouia amylolytica]|uniref:Site-specific recombinase XerD n=1 Tax=Zhouia amylolytica TaxID=376730 RepID=A0A1I6T2V7_9FLAO|nr:site-specific integrase [Zhouia amylolytica]SFS83591.1 Site-specific recombinase XerD [Zhouia amylolytica]